MNIEQKVLSLLQKKHNLPEQKDIYTFNYVESGFIDSLEIVQFLFNIEEIFNIEFTDDEIRSEKIKTVGGIINLIKSKS